VAEYRASEGKTVEVPYRGSVLGTAQDILGKFMWYRICIIHRFVCLQVEFVVVVLMWVQAN
jgi:hypothetical protein